MGGLAVRSMRRVFEVRRLLGVRRVRVVVVCLLHSHTLMSANSSTLYADAVPLLQRTPAVCEDSRPGLSARGSAILSVPNT